jgi:hypothetical protein
MYNFYYNVAEAIPPEASSEAGAALMVGTTIAVVLVCLAIISMAADWIRR